MIKKLVPDPPHTFEELLTRLFDLLRCAAAVIYEAGDQHTGSDRNLAFAGLYLIDMAKALADELLNLISEHQES
ncbi:hypothetical protein M2401_004277 [Pseudomonas sp. JUb42]|jgi:hypothetical protein|uniref:DUF6124 family protein n=1 Tax=Pseudomonas sp. JUb42 TaxID=2940611 RepID=UPI0021689E64|nr:DUF3077 domain-containing protein [Pseudomonas sp. JUb42]MCS3470520.1 hypothetical protein [Pseudomonas sp. JUb42]